MKPLLCLLLAAAVALPAAAQTEYHFSPVNQANIATAAAQTEYHFTPLFSDT